MRAPATNATAAIGQSPKWLDHYNPYFAGKAVLIFIDNDISGETWADAVANGGHRFAHQVRMIRLPDLPEKGDVSDWLKTHSVKDLEAVIARSLPWSPPATKIVPRMKPPRSLK
jgi:putative DNA primase/helicase